MVCEADDFAGQEIQGPTGPPGWRLGAGRSDQKGDLVARQLALSARSRLLGERAFQVGLHEPAAGPVDGRPRDLHGGRDHLVGDALVRRQEDLRALDLAGRVTPAAQKSLKLVKFRLAKLDMELYGHGRL